MTRDLRNLWTFLLSRDCTFHLLFKQFILNWIQAQRFAHARKAPSMDGRGAELFQAATVFRRGIAFVRREIVSGKDGIQFRHDRIARSFRDDGRGGNARRQGVALDDAALWSRTVRDAARIYQNEIRL